MNAGARPELAGTAVTLVEHDPREQVPLADVPYQCWTLPDGSAWTCFHRRGADYLLRFPGLADFEVSADGRRAQVWATPRTTTGTVHQLYLNQVLPLALSRLGRLVLHASAVDIEGQSVAFLAESGRGKSTLAAAFASAGSRFLTDDGLQIEWIDGEPAVVPSHPSIRLWEDSRLQLGGEALETAEPAEYTSKARFLAGSGLSFCAETLPLRRVYLLGPGTAERISVRAAKPAEAVMAMVRNSFVLDIAEHRMLAQHFGDITRIANLPLHYHLDYPRRYEDLPRLRQAIARHLADPASPLDAR